MGELSRLRQSRRLKTGKGFIETPFHRLRFNPGHRPRRRCSRGRVRREFVDDKADWPLFGYVRETPDPRHIGSTRRNWAATRNSYRLDEDSRRPSLLTDDWKARREGSRRLIGLARRTKRIWREPRAGMEGPASCRRRESGTTPTSGFFAQAVPWLTRRIELLGAEGDVAFNKADVRHAEAKCVGSRWH